MTENEDSEPKFTEFGKLVFASEKVEEIKEVKKTDTVKVSPINLDEDFKSAFATTKEDEDVQAEQRSETPVPPWRILFVGNPDLIARIEFGFNAETLEKAKKIKSDRLRKSLLSANAQINHNKSKRIFLGSDTYDDKTLENIVKKNIRNPACSSLYHVMVACSGNPHTSSKIVENLRNYGLTREEGFMMPYILVGSFLLDAKIPVMGRNVFFYEPGDKPDSEILKDLNKLFKDSLEASYTEKEKRHTVLVMGDASPYEQVEVPGNKIIFIQVDSDEEGYKKAREIIEKRYLGAVIVDGDNLYQKRLVFKIRNECPNTIPLAFGISDEIATKYGASQFDQDAYNTPEKRMRKLAREMEDKLRRYKFTESTKGQVEYEDDIILIDSKGKAFKGKRARFE